MVLCRAGVPFWAWPFDEERAERSDVHAAWQSVVPALADKDGQRVLEAVVGDALAFRAAVSKHPPLRGRATAGPACRGCASTSPGGGRVGGGPPGGRGDPGRGQAGRPAGAAGAAAGGELGGPQSGHSPAPRRPAARQGQA